MNNEIEFTQESEIVKIPNKYQWVFKTEKSPLWNITPMYFTKEQFLKFIEDHNTVCVNNFIIEFKKIKNTKLTK